MGTRSSFQDAGPEHVQRCERLSEDPRRVGAEPPLDQRGVDATEIDRGLEVVAEHQIREAWRGAIQTTLDSITDDEVHLRGTVIGTEAGVLRHAPAELAVDVHHDIVGPSHAL
jgi:hypothetical protein